MKEYRLEDYFNYLNIPESWDTLDEFADWFMESRMPLCIPQVGEIFCTDDATAVPLFIKYPYQVELYLIHPRSRTPEHSHPNTEIITMNISNMIGLMPWGKATPTLKDNRRHSGNFYSRRGTAMLTFERWLNGTEITSAAVNWKGPTVGPKQEVLIKRYYPNAVLENGWADTGACTITTSSITLSTTTL